MKQLLQIILTISTIIFSTITAFPAPGDLDLTFNSTGKLNLGFGFGEDIGLAMAVQTDGKIVTAGYSFNGVDNDFSVVRYNLNGSLDTTFDGDGKVTTDYFLFYNEAASIAIQSDGKIVVAGKTRTQRESGNQFNLDFMVVRYNINGSLDTTFDSDGIVRTSFDTDSDSANSIAIQPDGKIVVVGGSGSPTVNFIAARYNTDGSLDSSFGSNGKVSFSINLIASANSVAIQSDGKIIFAGTDISLSTINHVFAVARCNPDGSLDTSFDGDGKLTTVIGGINDVANSVKIQSDGKIVVGGTANSETTNNNFAVVRYNSVGSLDTSFDGDGKLTTQILPVEDSFGRSVELQSGGKILLSGSTRDGLYGDFATVRYNSDGSLDTAFDTDGKVVTSIADYDAANSTVVLPDGKILVFGNSDDFDTDFAIVRYFADGSLDTGFDSDGKTTANIGNNIASIKDLAIQSDGKPVICGNFFNGSDEEFAIVRLNLNGSLDATFGNNGKVTTDIGNRSEDICNSIAVQTNGKITAAGYFFNGTDYDFAVVRYNANGTLDATFDIDGKVITDVDSRFDKANSVAIQTDGKIVVTGVSQINAATEVQTVRYNVDGSLDTTFDSDGVIITPISENDAGNSIAIQTDGKIVVGGYTHTPLPENIQDFALIRYNLNGTLDNTFGTGGIVKTSIGIDVSRINSIAIQPDGKIVAVGTSLSSVGSDSLDFALARYNTNGSLDTSFDSDGKLLTRININDEAFSVAIQPDGKIVAAGTTQVTGLAEGFDNNYAVVRYNPNGSLDNSSFSNTQDLFGVGGIVQTDGNGGSDSAKALAIQNDGKILIGGESSNLFGLARYQNFAPTAANASINGRISTASNRGIRNVLLTLADTTTGEIKYTRTNPFGYYRFQDLETGRSYVLTVNSKRFTFANPTRVISLDEDLTGEDFIAEEK